MSTRAVEKNFQLCNKQLLDKVFVMSGIIKVEVSVISRAEGRHKHFGAVIGSRGYLKEYCGSEKVTNWINDISKLAEFALSQPQACYVAYTFGLNIGGRTL